MLKVVQINTFPNKATGAIMFSIHKELLKQGHESYVFWGRGRDGRDSYEYSFYNKYEIMYHGIMSRLFDNTGIYSQKSTRKMIQKLEEIKPDVVHLHNIHGYYLNIKILFEWLKVHQITIVWTFHDCWPFTGHCAYFDFVQCHKWKTGCFDCSQKSSYPASSFLDNSKNNWNFKRKRFDYDKLTIVTPSYWLKSLVQESFFADKKCEVIHNGINTNIFKPSDVTMSDGRFKVLGVASEWTPRKGLADFYKLYDILDKERVQVIIVGLSEKQIKVTPKGITALKRTENIYELVKLYQEADLFFNPTYEDNYPTTNLEALACGTPVCTYKTGGSVECINESNGFITKQGDVESVKKIIDIHLNMRKMGLHFNPSDFELDEHTMASKYVDLYHQIL